MLKAIARLLFGGEEQPPDDFKSGEMSEEEWQVVSHQEVSSAENQGPEQAAVQRSGSAQPQAANTQAPDVSSLLDPEPAGQSGAARPAAAQLRPPIAPEQLSLIPKGRTWAERHHGTRHNMQRHNRVRQGIQPSLFHLQQPGRRSLAH
uniref:Uncharacterized protein n=1 Tax=Tetraodon nigroviridis TaxID=99883 RepID=H3C9R5_TETNG